MSAITYADVRSCLNELLPSAPLAEVDKAATVLLLMFKVAGTAPRTTAKPAAKKPRQYKEKSVADSLKLKR